MVFVVLTRAALAASSRLVLTSTHATTTRPLTFCLLQQQRHNLSNSTSKEDPNLEIPPEFKDSAPDVVEMSTGIEKAQLIALLHGDNRYEPKVYARGPGTKDQPNIVPIMGGESRIVGCVCEPDQCYINYMCINMGEMKRCECGYWFKSVKGDPTIF